MSFRIAALMMVAGVTAVTAGCVVEQPAPRPRPGYMAAPGYAEVITSQPPPMTAVEQIPPPRPGYIWSRGYWRWQGGQYVAVRGHWEQMHPGYHYVHPHWEKGRGGWHFRAGVWIAG